MHHYIGGIMPVAPIGIKDYAFFCMFATPINRVSDPDPYPDPHGSALI
jgi:hypothetical protein